MGMYREVRLGLTTHSYLIRKAEAVPVQLSRTTVPAYLLCDVIHS